MSDTQRANIHATAIVVGTRGILFTGPSGSGKSMLAFACLSAARRQGVFSALVADDQVFVSRENDRLVAHRPQTIAGLIELRGSGIIEVDSAPSAALDLAVRVLSSPNDERYPPDNERFALSGLGDIPLVRLWSLFPEPLSALSGLFPAFRGERPF